MPFELLFDKKAVKELQKLPVSLRERILSKLREAKEDPARFFARLSGRLDYKLRVGDYRVIVDLKWDERKIWVLKIGSRKNVYERL